MWYRDFYPRSRPRKAKGGKFGSSWWAKRWIAVLESFNIGARRRTRGAIDQKAVAVGKESVW